MPLLGPAAMLLSFDVDAAALVEHDDWHTHEHLPERLSIPGFRRATRWVATRGGPRYLVLYEVAELATLSSDAYLARLNAPTPWTARMMTHYRGMRRGFCAVAASVGFGIGPFAALLRFDIAPGSKAPLRQWLVEDVLPPLPARPGLGSAHLFEGAATPPMTNEQRIRGADAGVGRALLVTAYDADALAAASASFGAAALQAHGATDVAETTYRLDYLLTRDELDAR
jgi:hypothetical protein